MEQIHKWAGMKANFCRVVDMEKDAISGEEWFTMDSSLMTVLGEKEWLKSVRQVFGATFNQNKEYWI